MATTDGKKKATKVDTKKTEKAAVKKIIETSVEDIQKELLRAYFQDMRTSFAKKYTSTTNLQKLLDPSSTKNRALLKKISETIPKKNYVITLNEFDRQIILDRIDGSCIGDDLIKHLKAALKTPVEDGVKVRFDEDDED